MANIHPCHGCAPGSIPGWTAKQLKTKQNEMLKFKLGLWGVVGTTMIYIYIMNLFFSYVINREVDEILQIGASFIALFYTVFQIKLIVKEITNLFNKKEKEND